MSKDQLVEAVVAKAKDLDNDDPRLVRDPEQDGEYVQEVKFLTDEDGHVLEVYAVLEIGGPHIQVACLSGRVEGNWSLEEHTTHTNSTMVEEFGRRQAQRYESEVSGV